MLRMSADFEICIFRNSAVALAFWSGSSIGCLVYSAKLHGSSDTQTEAINARQLCVAFSCGLASLFLAGRSGLEGWKATAVRDLTFWPTDLRAGFSVSHFSFLVGWFQDRVGLPSATNNDGFCIICWFLVDLKIKNSIIFLFLWWNLVELWHFSP